MIYPFIGPYTPQQIINYTEEKLNVQGCYIVCNQSNNLTYVGKSNFILNRIKQHYRQAGGNSCLYMDYINGDNIEIYFVRLDDTDFEELSILEGYLIKLMNSVKYGYNDRNESINEFKNTNEQYLTITTFFDFMKQIIPLIKGWIEAQFYETDYSDILCYFPFDILWELFKTWCRKNGKTTCYKNKSIGILYLWCQANNQNWEYISENNKITFRPQTDLPVSFLAQYPNDSLCEKTGYFKHELYGKEYNGGLFYKI